MHSGENKVVLVLRRCRYRSLDILDTVLVRALQGQFGQKSIQIVECGGHLLELLQPGLAGGMIIGITFLENRRVECKNLFQGRCGRGFSRAQGVDQGKGLVHVRELPGRLGNTVLIPLQNGLAKTQAGFGPQALDVGQGSRPGRQIRRVEDQPQIGQHVPDMRGLSELEAAVLAKAYADPVQEQFHRIGLESGPEEHGNVPQAAGLGELTDLVHHDPGLGLVAHGMDQLWFGPCDPPGEQVLLKAAVRSLEHGVGQVQDGLCGAVVFLQANHGGSGKQFGKGKNIAHLSPAKRIDGLSVVAHNHDSAAVAGQMTH